VQNKIIIVIFTVSGFILGAGLGYIAGECRSADKIVKINRGNDSLNREYRERQRIAEEQNKIIGDVVIECIEHVESAGAIIERTGKNVPRAVNNLTDARNYLKEGIKERDDLKMELDRLRAHLHGLGDLVGVSDR